MIVTASCSFHTFPEWKYGAVAATLRSGAALQLNEVGDALRRHEILTSRNASPSRLLKRLAAHFELVPADKPRTVRFLGAPSA